MADNFMPMSPAMMPFYDTGAIAQNVADMQKLQQQQALAQALMQAPYAPGSGRAGVFAGGLTRLLGMLQNNQSNSKLADLLKTQFEIQNQAAEGKRKQDLEDEYRKLNEEITKGVQIARGTQQAQKEFALPKIENGLMIDPNTGQATPVAGWNDAAIALERQKAAIAAANRQGPEDPFRNIKGALAQGLITQEEATKRMHDVALGLSDKGANAPAGYAWTPQGTLNAIPGGPADPATQMNKPQPVSAENRTKLGLLDAAQSALDNYKAQGTKNGVPTPLGNAFSVGNTANTSLDEAIANVLRVESGAAISAGEIAAAKDRYAPGTLRSDKENQNRIDMLGKKIAAQRNAILQGTNEAAQGGGAPMTPAGGHKMGDVLTVNGRQWKVVGGSPQDPELAPM